MLCGQRGRGGSARGTDQRCLDTGQGIASRGIVQNQDSDARAKLLALFSGKLDIHLMPLF